MTYKILRPESKFILYVILPLCPCQPVLHPLLTLYTVANAYTVANTLYCC